MPCIRLLDSTYRSRPGITPGNVASRRGYFIYLGGMDTQRRIFGYIAINAQWRAKVRGEKSCGSLNLTTISRIPHATPQLLLTFLTAYESKSQSSRFNQLSHLCSVCFETRKGSECLQLCCGHTFCRACLRDGWGLYITEGDIARVGCLSPQCVKDGQVANEDEVRRVVMEAEVRRWKWLREKKTSEIGKSTTCKYLNAHDL